MLNWIAGRRVALLLALRILASTLLAFVAAHLLGLAQVSWAVLTAIIVMQGSVGGSLQATRDRLLGSLGGAAWGVCVSLGVPHGDAVSLGLALALAVAPLAVLTAMKPAYRVASVTAVILLLTPAAQIGDPVAAALHRLMEVIVGSLSAVAVSMLLVPARAHGAVADALSKALGEMSALIPALMAGLVQPRDPDAVESRHRLIRSHLAAAETAAAEADSERALMLTGGPDLAALCRTSRRLHHDMVIIGRATLSPLPAETRPVLAAPALGAQEAVEEFLSAASKAIGSRAPGPSPTEPVAALDAFAGALAELRGAGVTARLSDQDVARLFGLAFALEQLGRDLRDLADRLADQAEP